VFGLKRNTRPRWRRGRTQAAVSLLAIALAVGGCEPASEELILASTTSTEDSGLFDVLIPAFEAAHPGTTVKVIAVGSGEALEYGRRKDADVLLVHAPLPELLFMDAGHGEARYEVMYNDYVLVGPADDPADLRAPMSALEGLRRIAAAGGPFLSRGDSSGTHQKEVALWAEAGVRPDPRWYIEIGQGMGDALRVASERQAYTLTDRSTYLFLRDGLALDVVLEGDDILFNPYGVIVVEGARNVEGARAFARWITGREGQEVIGAFGRERFGRPLFLPNASPAPHPTPPS
jgi:tungstate transport system substrate-binding protein